MLAWCRVVFCRLVTWKLPRSLRRSPVPEGEEKCKDAKQPLLEAAFLRLRLSKYRPLLTHCRCAKARQPLPPSLLLRSALPASPPPTVGVSSRILLSFQSFHSLVWTKSVFFLSALHGHPQPGPSLDGQEYTPPRQGSQSAGSPPTPVLPRQGPLPDIRQPDRSALWHPSSAEFLD